MNEKPFLPSKFKNIPIPPFWKVTGWPLRVYQAGFFLIGVMSFTGILPLESITAIWCVYGLSGFFFTTGKKTWRNLMRDDETWLDASYVCVAVGCVIGWLVSMM